MSNVSLINGHIDEVNTCGKCIHYEICSPYTAPNESYPEVNGCKCFKAKEDMVEVVRCKDCEYCCISTDLKTNISIQKCGFVGFNPVQSSQVSDDFYCSYGERRGKEE